MIILVINAGSSSLKYQLFETVDGSVPAKGICERIGLPSSRVKHTAVNPCRTHEAEVEMNNHEDAIRAVVDLLIHPELGVLKDIHDIKAVGHRVVHGGERISKPMLITDEVLHIIEECCILSPLHNPANLTGINACHAILPEVPQAAVFDTAFHQTMPEHAFLYPIPYEYYEKNKVRRYGFHGTSHSYVSERAAKMLNRPIEELRIITCHLGNGSSVTAIRNGCSVDTSMGLTPLEGPPMGTRSGSIDPAILEFIMKKENISIEEMLSVLNKKSGMLGLSGISSDYRDLQQAAESGNERAKMALRVFCTSVKKYVGAYAAVLGGVDALVFTAGIGENNWVVRADISTGLEYMGLHLNADKNKGLTGTEADISADGSPARILVIPTNEELVIAHSTEELVVKKT
jgi:acetate kinase